MRSTRLIGRRTAVGAALAGLAGCQPVPGTAPDRAATTPAVELKLGPDGTGYTAFLAPITPITSTLFRANIDKLLALNPARITVAISSPGGAVLSAKEMIATMNRVRTERGIPVTTHNIGVVASAACYVFLAGQRRLCVPRGNFLFHAAGVAAMGVLTSEALQQAADNLREDERFFHTMLKVRTHLTEAEIPSFLHRTVILNAEEARRDGIADTIADFTTPPGATIPAIGTRPPPAPPPPRPAASTPGTP